MAEQLVRSREQLLLTGSRDEQVTGEPPGGALIGGPGVGAVWGGKNKRNVCKFAA